jgi:PAS domain-containing protein
MTERERDLGDPTTEDLEDLYENAPCGYLSIKPDGRIVKVNATFSRWIGWAPEQLVLLQKLALACVLSTKG